MDLTDVFALVAIIAGIGCIFAFRQIYKDFGLGSK